MPTTTARAVVGLVLAAVMIGACIAVEPDNSAPLTAGSDVPPNGSDTQSNGSATQSNGSDTQSNGSETSSGGTDASPEGADMAGERDGGCRAVDSRTSGRVEREEVIEASGVVASRRHDDVLWVHNDSGQAAGVFAVGIDGEDLGFFELMGPDGPVAATDIEDIAIRDETIYLGDIGDNRAGRPSIAIHLLDEPNPGADGVGRVRRTITARYPDGPTDAEAMIVDPATGEILILSKDLEDGEAPTRLYRLPPRFQQEVDEARESGDGGTEDGQGAEPGEPAELELVGSLDVAELTARSSVFSINGLLFPGSVTGADVTAAGDLIALRTYGSVWLFDRAPDQTLADALAGQPCEGPVRSEAQGEAIGFLPGSDAEAESGDEPVRYVTISEGSNPPINVAAADVEGMGRP